jgi:XTP/dITP diphosphohydrolase
MANRYGGDDRSFENNIDKLLANLDKSPDRSARFRTVVALIINGRQTLFEGIAEGRITRIRSGGFGFGYDPVFIPSGAEKTFAEMSMEEKNLYSHRKKAIDKLVTFLNDLS